MCGVWDAWPYSVSHHTMDGLQVMLHPRYVLSDVVVPTWFPIRIVTAVANESYRPGLGNSGSSRVIRSLSWISPYSNMPDSIDDANLLCSEKDMKELLIATERKLIMLKQWFVRITWRKVILNSWCLVVERAIVNFKLNLNGSEIQRVHEVKFCSVIIDDVGNCI